jgi:hypothetical protein
MPFRVQSCGEMPTAQSLQEMANRLLACGACEYILVSGLSAVDVADAIFQCGRCGVFNKPKTL